MRSKVRVGRVLTLGHCERARSWRVERSKIRLEFVGKDLIIFMSLFKLTAFLSVQIVVTEKEAASDAMHPPPPPHD